jgi:hypothetical protein
MGIKNTLASVLLLDSAVGKFMGNFFLAINKPPIPIKIFTSGTEAYTWITQFLPKKKITTTAVS